MAAKVLRLSVSRLKMAQECGEKYNLRYNLKWRPRIESANLVFGSVVHSVIESYLISLHRGVAFDCESAFRGRWKAETAKTAISYSSIWSQDKLEETGARLCAQFPEYWESTGYSVLVLPDGSLFLEKKMSIKVQGIEVPFIPDLVVMTSEGKILVLDLKTPAQPSFDGYVELDEQLALYQLGVETHGGPWGIDRVDGVGLIEFIKRPVPQTSKGRGPYIAEPTIAGRRSNEQIAHLLQSMLAEADNIQHGRLYRRTGYAFNSPCGLCDFQNYCRTGSTADLIIPQQKAA